MRFLGRPSLRSVGENGSGFAGFENNSWKVFSFMNCRICENEILVKASQWMALTNDMVLALRYHVKAINFLAHAEFTFAPDEVFYASIASILFPWKTKDTGPTLSGWPRNSGSHPINLDDHPRYIFHGIQRGYLFARKFTMGENGMQRKKSLDSLRRIYDLNNQYT
jgi:hypothetical protein